MIPQESMRRCLDVFVAVLILEESAPGPAA